MSRFLVFLQFFLLGLIAFPFNRPAFTLSSLILVGAGLVVLFMALLAMKMRTFSVLPEPRAEGELITDGIYRLVRHPMYLAVLLCAAAACVAYQASWKWGLSGLLLLVLVIKMRREERMLLQRYAGYAAYCARVKRIIPLVL